MEGKKISFGFSKVNKKTNLLTKNDTVETETKVELIKCLEGQEIKLVEEKAEERPLIIPLKESQTTSAALASLMKRRAVLLGEEEPEGTSSKNEISDNITANNCTEGTEDIEKRATRELLAEIQSNVSTDPVNNLVLPVVKSDDLSLEGAKESTLDDYESIPIQDFGKAMLRGMGWKEPSKNNKKGGPPIDEQPMVRPKGMGLGADKALIKKPLLVAPESNEVLEVKRNAYVRILGGRHKDLYGQIEGFDDHAGLVIVKMAIGSTKETFNEFLCQPVSRKEYAQYGKCINSTKYEEYKKKENKYGQIIANKDEKNQIYKDVKEEKKVKMDRLDPPGKDYKNGKSNIYRNEITKDKREDGRDITENYSSKERDCEGDNVMCDEKNRSRKEDRDCRTELNRGDVPRYHKKEYNRDEGNSSKYDNTYRNTRRDYYDSESDCERRSRNKKCDRDRQSVRDREYYAEHTEKRNDKATTLDGSSDSESVAHSSKHKKTKKHKKLNKKLKKSKKHKSKYDSETSDTDSSSSDSEEEKYKKHKKKTKKSKKQRERSRSKGKR